jgi:hypothetical protein
MARAAPVKQPCCETWAKAHEWGTDNEGYAPIVLYVGVGDEVTNHIADLKAHIGYSGGDGIAEPVRFCPWCGAGKR